MSKVSATELYYDILADRYDSLTTAKGAWNAPSEVQEALNFVGNSSSVLVIGIGTGQEVDSLLSLGVKHIEGVDLSARMLEICSINYPSTILHHADFMDELQLKSTKFDLIICSGTSEFISDIDGFFLKCANLLEVDGSFIFTFEPLIDYHSIQAEPQSSSKSTASGNAPPSDFITYRRKLFDIIRIASTNSLTPTLHKEYVSYRKGGVDIIYHILLLKFNSE